MRRRNGEIEKEEEERTKTISVLYEKRLSINQLLNLKNQLKIVFSKFYFLAIIFQHMVMLSSGN